jgi:hypothetical protein
MQDVEYDYALMDLALPNGTNYFIPATKSLEEPSEI